MAKVIVGGIFAVIVAAELGFSYVAGKILNTKTFGDYWRHNYPEDFD